MSAETFDPDWTLPRRFWLVRRPGDEILAEGVVWSGGRVALHRSGRVAWSGQWASLDDMLKCHSQAVGVAWADEDNDLHRNCVEYFGGAVWIH